MKKVMRISIEEQYKNMSSAELMHEFSRINEFSQYDTNMPKEDIIIKLKYLQCTRHLICWHDDATLSGHGYILMTFSELYNPAILLQSSKKIFTSSLILRNQYPT